MDIEIGEEDSTQIMRGELTLGQIIDGLLNATERPGFAVGEINPGDRIRIERVTKQTQVMEKMTKLPNEVVNEILLRDHTLCSINWDSANDKTKNILRYILEVFRKLLQEMLRHVFNHIPLEQDHASHDDDDDDTHDDYPPVDKFTLQFSVRPNHINIETGTSISNLGVNPMYLKRNFDCPLARSAIQGDDSNGAKAMRYGYHLLSNTVQNKIIPDHGSWEFHHNLGGFDAEKNPYWYDSQEDDANYWPPTIHSLHGVPNTPATDSWPNMALEENPPLPVVGNEKAWLRFLQQTAESEFYTEKDSARSSYFKPDYVLMSLVDRKDYKILEFEYNLIETSNRTPRDTGTPEFLSRKHIKNLNIIEASLRKFKEKAKKLCQLSSRGQWVGGRNLSLMN